MRFKWRVRLSVARTGAFENGDVAIPNAIHCYVGGRELLRSEIEFPAYLVEYANTRIAHEEFYQRINKGLGIGCYFLFAHNLWVHDSVMAYIIMIGFFISIYSYVRAERRKNESRTLLKLWEIPGGEKYTPAPTGARDRASQ